MLTHVDRWEAADLAAGSPPADLQAAQVGFDGVGRPHRVQLKQNVLHRARTCATRTRRNNDNFYQVPLNAADQCCLLHVHSFLQLPSCARTHHHHQPTEPPQGRAYDALRSCSWSMRRWRYAAGSSAAKEVDAPGGAPICRAVVPDGASSCTLSSNKPVLSDVLPAPVH